MPAIIPRPNQYRFPTVETIPSVRPPHYECLDLPAALKLMVYLPGVDPGGVAVTTQGPDIFITARKPRPVRVNWPALQLEGAQSDYRLKLRLGHDLDFEALQASLAQGLLTIIVPKIGVAAARPADRPRRVA